MILFNIVVQEQHGDGRVFVEILTPPSHATPHEVQFSNELKDRLSAIVLEAAKRTGAKPVFVGGWGKPSGQN